MVWGTNESLASHTTENPITIQNKRQDRKHTENPLKSSLKWILMETPWLEMTKLSILAPKGQKERHQFVPEWLSSTPDRNLAADGDFTRKSRVNPSYRILNCG